MANGDTLPTWGNTRKNMLGVHGTCILGTKRHHVRSAALFRSISLHCRQSACQFFLLWDVKLAVGKQLARIRLNLKEQLWGPHLTCQCSFWSFVTFSELSPIFFSCLHATYINHPTFGMEHFRWSHTFSCPLFRRMLSPPGLIQVRCWVSIGGLQHMQAVLVWTELTESIGSLSPLVAVCVAKKIGGFPHVSSRTFCSPPCSSWRGELLGGGLQNGGFSGCFSVKAFPLFNRECFL